MRLELCPFMGHSIYREVVVYYVLIGATRKRAASKKTRQVKMVGNTQRTATAITKDTRAVPIVIVRLAE